MTQESAGALPKFFKDAEGYCYTATALLVGQAHLTPWDGSVNAAGFAVTEESVPAPAPTTGLTLHPPLPVKPASKSAKGKA